MMVRLRLSQIVRATPAKEADNAVVKKKSTKSRSAKKSASKRAPAKKKSGKKK